MDVVLVSARPRGASAHPRCAQVEQLAGGLAAAGHRVRWLCPLPPESAAGGVVPAPAGVEVRAIHGEPEGFAAVQDRLYDIPLEQAYVGWLRPDPPDVVHIDGYGGVSSYMSTWIATRLGVPSLVVADSRDDLLCHRGTLVDETGAPCERWAEPARCFACCTTPVRSRPVGIAAPGEGLSSAAAFWARVTRGLGPLSKPPRQVDFENRLDIIVHGLDNADVVLFADQRTCDDLLASQLPKRGAEVGIPAADEVDAWLAAYARAIELAGGG